MDFFKLGIAFQKAKAKKTANNGIYQNSIKNEKINGIITALYLIWYGTIRFGIEILRTDALLIGNLKIAQITSLVMIGLGVIILINVFFKKQKGLYENSN